MVNTKNPTRTYRQRSAADWQTLIKQCDESDLSIADFCKQHNIATSGLYTWRKRFTEESSTAPEETFIEVTPQITSSPSQTDASKKSWDVELELGQGCILRIRSA